MGCCDKKRLIKLLPKGIKFNFEKPNTDIEFEKTNGYKSQSVKIIKHYFKSNTTISGIEIGTMAGEWTKRILSECKNVNLITVDPWIHQPDVKNGAGRPQEFHNQQKTIAFNCLKSFEDRVEILEMKSEDAFLKLEQTEKLYDFCFIDGNPSFSMVKKDLEKAFKLVKEGGIIGGHKFLKNIEVTLAIGNFFHDKKIKVNLGGDYTWWIKK